MHNTKSLHKGQIPLWLRFEPGLLQPQCRVLTTIPAQHTAKMLAIGVCPLIFLMQNIHNIFLLCSWTTIGSCTFLSVRSSFSISLSPFWYKIKNHSHLSGSGQCISTSLLGGLLVFNHASPTSFQSPEGSLLASTLFLLPHTDPMDPTEDRMRNVVELSPGA